MRATTSRFAPVILGLSLAALVACGSETTPNTNASVATVQRPSSSDLLYVLNHGDSGKGNIDVLTYPRGKLSQGISNSNGVNGECVDKHGDVFVTGNYEVTEYAHGSSHLKTILSGLGFTGGEPQGCAIDPVSGDLAVAIDGETTSARAVVAIYKRAKGTPTYYTDDGLNAFAYCSYDSRGNLFLDGTTQYFTGYLSYIAELPSGATKFTNVAVSQWLSSFDLGGVQWDGTYLAVGDSYRTIYRFSIEDGRATKVGKITLGGAYRVYQFWIDGSDVIGGNTETGMVQVWKYPTGGPATKTIQGFGIPIAVAISK